MKILILASNPKHDLALDREIKDLQGVIKRSRSRDQLEVSVGSAVSPEDLQELLLDVEPQIVHFCGHGTGEQGLVFEHQQGRREQIVSTEALSNLFELISEQVKCVVLNACYSEVQAEAISRHIPYVVGMSQTIQDDAAVAFSTGFYRALGFNRSIEQAYKFGCNAIQLSFSGSSTHRSVSDRQDRKLEVCSADSSSQAVIVPEHLKPVLKKNPALSILVEKASPEPEQAAVSTQEVQLEVRKALEKEVNLKHYRDRVRAALANGKITPDGINRLTQFATQLNLSASEASAILQEEQASRPITIPPAASRKTSKFPIIWGSVLGILVLPAILLFGSLMRDNPPSGDGGGSGDTPAEPVDPPTPSTPGVGGPGGASPAVGGLGAPPSPTGGESGDTPSAPVIPVDAPAPSTPGGEGSGGASPTTGGPVDAPAPPTTAGDSGDTSSAPGGELVDSHSTSTGSGDHSSISSEGDASGEPSQHFSHAENNAPTEHASVPDEQAQ